MVSTHAPARGQSWDEHGQEIADTLFQLMPPRGGNPAKYQDSLQDMKFQLMPPRGGNRETPITREQLSDVSTHAPARGQSILFKNGTL